VSHDLALLLLLVCNNFNDLWFSDDKLEILAKLDDTLCDMTG